MDDEMEELRVTFFPALYLQRRVWVLSVLRREGFTSVLDVGCGEGELLKVLCQPAPWLRVTQTDLNFLRSEENVRLIEDIPFLHTKRVAGLDLSSSALNFAVEACEPPSKEGMLREIRWEALDTQIWEGALEVYNPEFSSFECIVAMEVIEHLPEDVLPKFAPMILGVYQPQVLLVTTPSYTFNARFTAPDTLKRSGFLDPTGRTDRVFRHSDHKFEWTTEEFGSWCESVAQEWGYSVKTSSIGAAREVDPWGRDEELGGATQTAEFVRLDGEEQVKLRTSKSALVVEGQPTGEGHTLLASFRHEAHESARKPASLSEIGSAVKTKMEGYRESFMRLEELWFETEIQVLCGGWLECLTSAVEAHDQLSLRKEDPQRRDTWKVELVGSMRLQFPPMEREDSTDFIPKGFLPIDVEPEESGEEPVNDLFESDGELGDESDAREYESDKAGWGNSQAQWASSDSFSSGWGGSH